MKSAVAVIRNSSSTSWVCCLADNTGCIPQLSEHLGTERDFPAVQEMNTLKTFFSSGTHRKTNRTGNNFVGFSKQSSGSMHQRDIFCTVPVCTERGNEKLRLSRCLRSSFSSAALGSPMVTFANRLVWIFLYSSHKFNFFPMQNTAL